MPAPTFLPEGLRNIIGRAAWNIGRDMDELAGHDQNVVDFVDRFGGMGTDAGSGAAVPGIMGEIKASHGSPHLFDRFSLSKPGSGAGGSAYGHGLYFGEGTDSRIADFYARYGGVGKGLPPGESGYVYNTGLRWPNAEREMADPMGPQHFIDWDKPAGRQSEYVSEHMKSHPEIREWSRTHPEEGMGELYRDMAHSMGKPAASQYFRDMDIPGLRYYDEPTSRMDNAARHNYVVFDDEIPNILERRGLRNQ